MLQTNGTTYLEIAEAIDLGGTQQQGNLRRLQVFLELAGFHEFRNLRQVGVFVQLLVDIHDMLQLLQKPAINLCQLMNLLDTVTHLQGFRHYEDTHVGRLVQRGSNIRNLDLVILHKAVHALPYHAETLLQGFLEGTTDGHHLTHRLHR